MDFVTFYVLLDFPVAGFYSETVESALYSEHHLFIKH